jgi:hypothetical protein
LEVGVTLKPFRALDYITDEETLEAYVGERIHLALAVAKPRRQPLTGEQIHQCVERLAREHRQIVPHDLVSAVEALHGIT